MGCNLGFAETMVFENHVKLGSGLKLDQIITEWLKDSSDFWCLKITSAHVAFIQKKDHDMVARTTSVSCVGYNSALILCMLRK